MKDSLFNLWLDFEGLESSPLRHLPSKTVIKRQRLKAWHQDGTILVVLTDQHGEMPNKRIVGEVLSLKSCFVVSCRQNTEEGEARGPFWLQTLLFCRVPVWNTAAVDCGRRDKKSPQRLLGGNGQQQNGKCLKKGMGQRKSTSGRRRARNKVTANDSDN